MAKIYVPKGKAREYSPLALNYYKGCDHGCDYCYVKPMMRRFNTAYEHNNVIESDSKISFCKDKTSQVLLSFTTDPYSSYDVDSMRTRRVLEQLLDSDHKVAILTKGGRRCLRDIDLFKKFGDRIKVGTSLTFENNSDSMTWEKGAALPSERLEVIAELKANNIFTWTSFEPVIDPIQSLNLIKKTINIVDYYKIGKLNNYRGLDKKIDWLKFMKEAINMLRVNDKMFYIKNDLAAFNDGSIVFSEKERDCDYMCNLIKQKQ